MVEDFRRRHPRAVLSEEFTIDCVLNEIHSAIAEISPAFTSESLNLQKLLKRPCRIQMEQTGLVVNIGSLECTELNTKT